MKWFWITLLLVCQAILASGRWVKRAYHHPSSHSVSTEEAFFHQLGQDYNIVNRYLGQGAYAKVMSVTSKKGSILDVKAVKYVTQDMFPGRQSHLFENAKSSLENEATIARLLGHHPNILEYDPQGVQVVESSLPYSAVRYLFMNYCEKGDIFNRLNQDPFSPDELKCVFWQIMQGVYYMHEKKVAHRDIKPENILLKADGTIKISDFGVSVQMIENEDGDYNKSTIESLFPIVGTFNYMAPELYHLLKTQHLYPPHTNEYDPFATDIWALGILYAVFRLDFYPPKTYEELKSFEWFDKDLMKQITTQLDKNESEFLLHLLERGTRVRYTAKQVVADAWFQNLKSSCPESIQALYP